MTTIYEYGPVVTVTDRLYTPEGVPVTGGAIAVTNTSTMITSQGQEIPQGTTWSARVGSQGGFSIDLMPNTSSTPAGTSYQVTYKVTDQVFTEMWIVPASPNPCTLADVRSLSAPIPDIMIPIVQVLPPSNMQSGNVPQWNGAQWVPGLVFNFQGQKTIVASDTSASFTFGVMYTNADPPAIVLTPTSDLTAAGGYWITNNGSAGQWTGFTINIHGALSEDATFNYIITG